MDELPDLKPVKLTCTSSDCDNGRHAYRPGRGKWQELGPGVCQNCGDTSVDMTVTRARDGARPDVIFAELGREFIRDHFLNKPFDERARRLIRRDGVEGIKQRVHDRLLRSLGGDPTNWDGRQTPLSGSVLFYAQHATATCCRKCAWYWYGIPRDGEMDAADLSFCDGLVCAYIDRRAPEIDAIHHAHESD